MLLNNAAWQDDNNVEKQIVLRQLTVKNEKSSSWFIYVRKTLLKYDLGDIHEHLMNPTEKKLWSVIWE